MAFLDETFLRPAKKLETQEDLESYAKGRGFENFEEMRNAIGFGDLQLLGAYVYAVDMIPDDLQEFDEKEPKEPVENVGHGTHHDWHYIFGSSKYRIYTWSVQLYKDADGVLFMEEVDD